MTRVISEAYNHNFVQFNIYDSLFYPFRSLFLYLDTGTKHTLSSFIGEIGSNNHISSSTSGKFLSVCRDNGGMCSSSDITINMNTQFTISTIANHISDLAPFFPSPQIAYLHLYNIPWLQVDIIFGKRREILNNVVDGNTSRYSNTSFRVFVHFLGLYSKYKLVWR